MNWTSSRPYLRQLPSQLLCNSLSFRQLERAVRNDGEQIAVDDASLLDGCGLVEETLDLGHARLRSECWVRLRRRPLRGSRPARARAPRHLARPSSAAEARFALGPCEFLE